jgi:hypothetical protein
MELSMRLMSVRDVEWIIAKDYCSGKDDLKQFVKKLHLNEIFPLSTHFSLSSQSKGGFILSAATLRTKFLSHIDDNSIRSRIIANELTEIPGELPGDVTKVKLVLSKKYLSVLTSMGGMTDNGELLYQRQYKASMIAVAPLPEHHAYCCFQYLLRCISKHNNPGILIQISYTTTIYVDVFHS